MTRPPTPSGHIEDGDLQARDVPAADADWPELWRFALTTDGYERLGSFEAVAELGNRAAATFAKRGELPQNLTTLRLALFFEQRRYHQFGEAPSGDSASYVRALVRAIGEAVAQARSSKPTGTAAGPRELSPDKKRQIRERLARGQTDSHVLSAEFGCSVQQIAAIKARNKR